MKNCYTGLPYWNMAGLFSTFCFYLCNAVGTRLKVSGWTRRFVLMGSFQNGLMCENRSTLARAAAACQKSNNNE